MRLIQNVFLGESPVEAEKKWIRHYVASGHALVNCQSLAQKPYSPEVPSGVLEFFKKQGARGGKKGWSNAWKKLTPEQRTERAKKAVAAREAKRKETK